MGKAHPIFDEILGVKSLDIRVLPDGTYAGAFLEGKTFLREGSEAAVYRDGGQVVKVVEPYHDKDASTFAVRVESALFVNAELGDGSLRLIGFYPSANGTPNPVFVQKFIEGRPATKQEIQTHMESRGWALSKQGKHSDEYQKPDQARVLTAKDLDGDNVKIGADGKITVIDAFIGEPSPSPGAGLRPARKIRPFTHG